MSNSSLYPYVFVDELPMLVLVAAFRLVFVKFPPMYSYKLPLARSQPTRFDPISPQAIFHVFEQLRCATLWKMPERRYVFVKPRRKRKKGADHDWLSP